MAIAQPSDTTANASDLVQASQPNPDVLGAHMGPNTGLERRMNIRAFDYWESLLDGRDFPAVAELDADIIAPFREHSLLIDFTRGYDAPVMRFVGRHLRAEASLRDLDIDLSDVPSGTLLSRLTNHYLEILANRAPIGFEAEFETEAGERVLYRGILLPLSDDGTTINFIYGVISWKTEDAAYKAGEFPVFDDDVIDLDAPIDPQDEELIELTQALDEAETDALMQAQTHADPNDMQDDELQNLMSEIDAVLAATQPSPEQGPPQDEVSPTASLQHDADPLLDAQIGDTPNLEVEDPASAHVSLEDDALARPDDLERPDVNNSAAEIANTQAAPETDLAEDAIEDFAAADVSADDESEGAAAPEVDVFAGETDIALGALQPDEGPDLGSDMHDVVTSGPLDDAVQDAAHEDAPDAVYNAGPSTQENFGTADDLDAAHDDNIDAEGILAEDTVPSAPELEASDEALLDLLVQCQAAASELVRFDSRSRAALYETLALGYDFHVATHAAPDAYTALLERAGISMQARAPMTPIVKL
ncbi:MAG: hypothetical protein AAF862_04115, partial [Pseudomonadota bacterium]